MHWQLSPGTAPRPDSAPLPTPTAEGNPPRAWGRAALQRQTRTALAPRSAVSRHAARGAGSLARRAMPAQGPTAAALASIAVTAAPRHFYSTVRLACASQTRSEMLSDPKGLQSVQGRAKQNTGVSATGRGTQKEGEEGGPGIQQNLA